MSISERSQLAILVEAAGQTWNPDQVGASVEAALASIKADRDATTRADNLEVILVNLRAEVAHLKEALGNAKADLIEAKRTKPDKKEDYAK